ncbi:MAG: GAF domain-containing protein, partial [Cyanobacteria bacterium J083]
MALSLSYNKQNLEKVIIVAIALFASGLIGHNLREIGLNISPFCFSGAIALVSVYVWGKVPIPGIIGGNLLLIPLLGQDWLLTFGSAIGISLAAIAGASLLRWCQFSGAIENLWHIAILMAVALLSSTINATFGICFEYLSRNITLVELGTNWWIFWLGDAIAILLFTPTLLRVRRKKIHLFSEHPPLKWLEAGICLTLLAIISWIVFASPSLTTIVWYPLEYLPFPFVVWSALRFGFFGAIFSSVLVGVIALEGVSRGVGPFVFKSPDPESAILLLQIFIAVITVTALVLATVVNERQQAEARLIESLKRDRVLAEVAQKIRKSLDIQAILSTTVRETRNLLGADRVFYVSYCKFSESAQVLAESVNYNYPKIKGWIPNQQIIDETRYLMGSQDLLAIDNVQAYKKTPALAQYYQRYQIKASLIIALRHKDEILGLLVAHQCSRYRHWRQSELELWSRIATQVTIALQQAQLYRKIQKLNSNLESQVEERTQQLAEKITEVEKLNELKQIFLQGISHDLRTSIMGLLMVFKNLQQRRQNQITLSESILQ